MDGYGSFYDKQAGLGVGLTTENSKHETKYIIRPSWEKRLSQNVVVD